MNKYLKKIMIVPILMMCSLGFVGCGEEKSVLFTENYLNANWDNNYKEVNIKAENLGENYEVITEENKISITDKKIKSVDNIEYIFDEGDKLVQINFRSNSKDISTKKYGTAMLFYIDGIKMVDSKETQVDFLSGKYVNDKTLDIDGVLLEAYSGVELDNLIYETRHYLEKFTNDIYVFKEEEGMKEGETHESILTNTKSSSRVVVKYIENIDKPNTGFLMKKISYELNDGRKLEINIKNGIEIDSFKVYNKGEKEGKSVESFGEQINFLRNK